MAKFMSEAEAENKRLKAVAFMDRIGGDSDKFKSMSAAEYAQTKGAELLNPSGRATMTKQELDELVDTLADGIEEALDPVLSREEVVAKLQELSDIASGEEPDTESDDEDE
jgi:hypothetical protein